MERWLRRRCRKLRRSLRIRRRKAVTLVEELSIRTQKVQPLMKKLEQISARMDELERQILREMHDEGGRRVAIPTGVVGRDDEDAPATRGFFKGAHVVTRGYRVTPEFPGTRRLCERYFW